MAQIYSDLGYLFLQQNNLNAAQQALNNARQSLAAVGRSDHPVRAEILNNQSMIYSSQGQNKQAITAIQQALQIVKKSYGEEHSDAVVLTANLAFEYTAIGQNQQAIPIWLEYIRLANAVFGPENKEASLGHVQIGATLVSTSKFREARRHLPAAVRLREQFDTDPNELAEAYAYTGLMYMGLEDWRRARKFLLKALITGDKNLEKNRVAMSVHLALAKLFASRTDLFDALSALEHLQKGIAATEKLYGNVPYLQQLKSQQTKMKSLAKSVFATSEETFDESQMVMVFDTTTIRSKNKVIATVPSGTRLWSFKEQGEWLLVKVPNSRSRGFIPKGSAASLQKNSMLNLLSQLSENGRQKFSELVAAENRRSVLKRAGKPKEGFQILEAALNELDRQVQKESGYQLDNAIISAFRLHIATFQALEGRISESLATLESVLEQQLVELGNHPHVAATKLLLADQLIQSGDFRRAEQEGRDALRIIDAVIGPQGVSSTIARSFLGTLLVKEGRIEEAKKLISGAYTTEKKFEPKRCLSKVSRFTGNGRTGLCGRKI